MNIKMDPFKEQGCFALVYLQPLFSCSGFILDRKFVVDFNNSTYQIAPEYLCEPGSSPGTRYKGEGVKLRRKCLRSLQALVTTGGYHEVLLRWLVLGGNVPSDNMSSLRPDHEFKGTWWDGANQAMSIHSLSRAPHLPSR